MTLAIDLTLALIAAIVFALIVWDINQTTRHMDENIRYRARLQARQPYPSKAEYLEAHRLAMLLTLRRYSDRLDQFVNERVDRPASDFELRVVR